MLRFLLPFCFVIYSCGVNPNPNSVFVTEHDKNRIDVLLARAKVEQDRNKLPKAKFFALQAYNRNPNNTNAAELLASIYVSEAHLSLLSIASRIANDLNVTGSNATGASKNTKVLDVLGVLADVVNLTEADYALLGTKEISTISYFTGLDVILPFKPGTHTDSTTPRGSVNSLRKLNQAIALLCPFVETSITDGINDSRYSCAKVTDSKIGNHAQVHFAFGIAHLLEAIIFNAVIQYSNSGPVSANATKAGSNSNLYQRVLAIQNIKISSTTSTEDAKKYADSIVLLVNDIKNILNFTDSNSMLTALTVDLRVTQQALTSIVGFPPSMLAKIQGIQTTIQNSIDQVGKTGTSVTNQSQAIQQQLSNQAITKLNSSITNFYNNMTEDQRKQNKTQIDQVCSSYSSVVGDLLNQSDVPAAPSFCT